jgi:hypothetical protein
MTGATANNLFPKVIPKEFQHTVHSTTLAFTAVPSNLCTCTERGPTCDGVDAHKLLDSAVVWTLLPAKSRLLSCHTALLARPHIRPSRRSCTPARRQSTARMSPWPKPTSPTAHQSASRQVSSSAEDALIDNIVHQLCHSTSRQSTALCSHQQQAVLLLVYTHSSCGAECWHQLELHSPDLEQQLYAMRHCCASRLARARRGGARQQQSRSSAHHLTSPPCTPAVHVLY